jgi:chemotaxis response regulator CheB
MSFPIVGIGASAGGLESISALLAGIPASTGMAYVFVQHLDPAHGSHLAKILSNRTALPVEEAARGILEDCEPRSEKPNESVAARLGNWPLAICPR